MKWGYKCIQEIAIYGTHKGKDYTHLSSQMLHQQIDKLQLCLRFWVELGHQSLKNKHSRWMNSENARVGDPY
jgi:hypothetical protein